MAGIRIEPKNKIFRSTSIGFRIKFTTIRKIKTAIIENKLVVKIAVFADGIPLAICRVTQNPTMGSNKITLPNKPKRRPQVPNSSGNRVRVTTKVKINPKIDPTSPTTREIKPE